MDSVGGGTTVGVDETKGLVLMIVITTDEMVMGGGIRVIEVKVVLITPLLLVSRNVTVVNEGIVTGIVDVFVTGGGLGSGVETINEPVKKTVVVTVLFVTLTELFGNPRDGVPPYIVVMVVVTLEEPIEVP